MRNNDWLLKDQKNGVCVYSRRSEFSKFNDIEVEIDLPGTIAQLSDILLAVEKYPEWAYSTKSAVPIRKIGANELIYYSEISVPWPLSNRDFYADVVLSYDSVRHSIFVVSRGLKDFLPEKKGLVRIPDLKRPGIFPRNRIMSFMCNISWRSIRAVPSLAGSPICLRRRGRWRHSEI